MFFRAAAAAAITSCRRPLLAAVVSLALLLPTPPALRAAGPTSPAPLVVKADKASGAYAVGETVRLSCEWTGSGPPPDAARYTLKSGGLKEVGQGELRFSGNTATLETKLDAPGTMLLEVKWPGEAGGNGNGKADADGGRAFSGVVAAPDQIMPAAPPPDDFDAFWKSKLDKLAQVPPNPKLTPADSGKPGVAYQKITLDNIRGTHVNGQLARPEQQQGEAKKLPALLIVQWAGVYPLQKAWVTERAADGWLALNILPHDLPIDEPESFYKEKFDGPLKNYWAIGNDDRETSYYLRMYLSCVRAIDYLKSRPDWDGKTLVVMGTSQGGQQALAVAGLRPGDVTAVLPFLPAACDMLAPEVGRASGFPFWHTQVHGKDPAKVRAASRYYDPVNFARKITCPVLIGLALHDDLAPPSSVLAAANVITAPKEVVILPRAGHQDENGSHRAYNDRAYGAWLPALREGKPPPVATTATATAMTAEQDHRRMLDQLKIDKLRRGADARPDSPFAANSDESKATPYSDLPDPLKMESGEAVTTAEAWWKQRRPELVELFDREIYGRVPANVPGVKWEVTSTSNEDVGGVPVVTKQLVGRADNSACPRIDVAIRMTLTTPAARAGERVPVMMAFTFGGPRGATTRRVGAASSRWDEQGPTWQQQVLARGWGYATLVPTSIQADNGAGLTQGIIGLANKGQPRKADDWGALRAWAWGASRALDYLEADDAVDAKRVGIEGLSRYGKAALVAMAYDPRFAIAFVGSSGAGGAKLLRRDFGERVENLASSGEYHWFAGNFLKYAGPLTPGDLPVDAHELIALCAPRPVFISVGSPTVEGTWVDARGMFLAAVGAGPVYRLLGKKDLGASDFPPIETALVDGDLAFRQHSGGHTTGPNWPTFLAFAERYMNSTAPANVSPSSSPAADRADQPAARMEDPVWVEKHRELVARAKQGNIDLYLAGDSITRRWAATHRASWDKNFSGWRAASFGAGGDRTQNQLYRLQNGELDGVHPKVVVLMIGTNNVGFAPPPPGGEDALAEDVAHGVEACVREIGRRAPDAKVLLMGITPRNTDGSTALMPTIDKINTGIETLADGERVRFLSINDRLADANGKLFVGVTEDGLHLSDRGYQVWADAMRPILTEWLGPPATPAAATSGPAAGVRGGERQGRS